MKTWRRLCLHDHILTDDKGTSFTLHGGREYVTSAVRESDGTLVVFSQFWVRVPAAWFDTTIVAE